MKILSVPVVIIWQAAPLPLPLPDLQANVDLWGVLAWAALNPAMIAVAFLMGRRWLIRRRMLA